MPVAVGSERPQVFASENPGGNLTLDFSAPDESARVVADFTREYPVSAVIAADDEGAVLAAAVAAVLGLAHNSVAAVSAARDKHRMRQVLAEAGIPSPRFELCSIEEDPGNLARRVSFPCVLKPLSLSGSRGVIRADDPAELAAAFRRTAAILRRPEVASQGSSARDVLIESFIAGAEVALEGLLAGGRLHVLAIFDKPDPLEGPFFEETIYVTPSRLPFSVQEGIAACAQSAVAALGLREGPVHAELRVNEQGAWMLEIAPRSIGGLCSRTLRFGPGLSLEELILRQALGLEWDVYPREPRSAGVMMIPIPRAGVLREVRGLREAASLPAIEEIKITIPLGGEVIPLPEGSRYLGFIFARDESPQRVETALREAHRSLAFVITPGEDPRRG